MAEINPVFGAGVFGKRKDVLAVGTGEAKAALATLGDAVGHAFAGAALVGAELRDGAVVAAV